MAIKIIEYIKNNKRDALLIFFVAAFIIVPFFLPKGFLERFGITTSPRIDPGKVAVQYLNGKQATVPYEPLAPIPGGLWERKHGEKNWPQPKTKDFKTSVSRADFSNATGYTGGCELPKIVREETNSAFCLQCHDNHGTPNPLLIPITLETSHPVGTAVPVGVGDYQPSYDPNLVMVNGVMQCTTCHDFWATPQWPQWVAMNPVNICNSCHNK